MQLSERVKQIAPAKTLEMAAKAREMRAQGIDVISMSLGEPDMDTPEHIRNDLCVRLLRNTKIGKARIV